MHTRVTLALLTALITLAGCASKPVEPTPALRDARAAYAQAKEDPEVLRYSEKDLSRAQKTLNQAAAATEVKDMDSLAYVANAEVQIAEARAQRSVAEARIEELGQVKDQVQLEMREAELMESRQRLEDREAELLASRQRLAAREAELEALKAKQTARGTVITLGNVLFATGRSELLPGAMDSIDRLASYLEKSPEETVLIEGHTDSTGSDETNRRLSRDRADSVRSALIAQGVSPSRIEAVGLASSRPVASNDTAAGRQQNRRVEIIIR
jgi:outer membrane protein OmpA-like peptidoglycan-associated protein